MDVIWRLFNHFVTSLVFGMAGENQVWAGMAGAIDAVVATMKTHVGNADVSEQACRALQNICINGAFVVN